jgi:tetratricopeptide (TPR) repeat protein
MTAVLSTFIADALMKLGRLRQSRAWYATARTAADDSGNVTLRARVRVQAAMLPYYYGPIDAAVELAREARLLTRGRPSATAAFAAAAEARALAQRHDEAGAAQAIAHAIAAFDRCDNPGDEGDAWAFPHRRLLLYLSGAYTALGQTRRAREIQQQALALYDDQTGIDPALLHLEAAIGLAHDRSPSEACQLASATYLQVPAAHRTPILVARAQYVITAVPPGMRGTRQVRELGEILALPPSTV